jgi:hypothetical protein
MLEKADDFSSVKLIDFGFAKTLEVEADVAAEEVNMYPLTEYCVL